MTGARYGSAKAAMLAASLVAAGWTVTGAAGAEQGGIRGLEVVEERLPWFDAEENYHGQPKEGYAPDDFAATEDDAVEAVTSTGQPPIEDGVALLASKQRYHAEDEYFDLIVRFDHPLDEAPEGRLVVRVVDDAGEVVSEDELSDIPGSQLYFSYAIPEAMVGEAGELAVSWEANGSAGADRAAIEVAEPAVDDVDRSGSVLMRIPNETGATVDAAPMLVGVPFPRGVLASTDDLRLLDEDGNEIPLQVAESARWSRYGSVRWVRLRFSVDLEGSDRALELVYGPNVTRERRADMTVDDAGGVPKIDAGRLQVERDGITFEADDEVHRIIDSGALTGGYVEDIVGINHSGWGGFQLTTGRRFRMTEPTFEVVEQGPVAVVLRSEGWYEDVESGERFCQYKTRYEIYRDSPVVKVYHTWIYTGDSNDDADQINDMGWRFSLAEDLEPLGFLTAFDDPGSWAEAFYLRQESYDGFTLFEHDVPGRGRRDPEDAVPHEPLAEIDSGERAPGVMAAEGTGVRVYLGVRDFWQNFPTALSFEDNALSFEQWPRYGTEPTHPNTWNDPDEGLTHWRLWFAHEGDTLNFRLPEPFTENPIYFNAGGGGVEPFYTYGRQDSLNAQGISKTSDLWLYVTDDETPTQEAGAVFEGLNKQTLRAVVDPEWMMASGVFHESRHRDEANYPDIEKQFDRIARSPLHQRERIDLYGKWLYGDQARYVDLNDPRVFSRYRGFFKSHHGWPYRFQPFFRSGDTGLLRAAYATARMMTDVAWVEYVDDDVREQFDDLPARANYTVLYFEPFREKGWHNRHMIPWAGYWGPTTRMYVDKVDYLWNAYHALGFERGRDVALQWAEATKDEREMDWGSGPITTAANRRRWPPNLQKQYLRTYRETFDPWFLAASHAIADMHVWATQNIDGFTMRFWNTGPRDFQRYTGSDEHFEGAYKPALEAFFDWRNVMGWASRTNRVADAAFAYHYTGDRYYLRMAAGYLDMARWYYFGSDDPWYYEGFAIGGQTRYPQPRRQGTNNTSLSMISWYHQYHQHLVDAVHADGGMPADFIPQPSTYELPPGSTVAVLKEGDESIRLRTGDASVVKGPDGERELEEHEDGGYVIPADAPDGTYRVETEDGWFPIAHPDVPEVVEPDGNEIGLPGALGQFYFRVPEGTDSFTITFDVLIPEHPGQVIVYDPDGNEAWAWREYFKDIEEEPGDRKEVRAELSVPAEHAGDLWRVAAPSPGVTVKLGDAVSGAVSHSRVKWVDLDD